MNPLRPRLRLSTVLIFTALCALFLTVFRGTGLGADPNASWFDSYVYPLVFSSLGALSFMIHPSSRATVRCVACGRAVFPRRDPRAEPLCPACRACRRHPEARRRAERTGLVLVAVLLLLLALMLAGPVSGILLGRSVWPVDPLSAGVLFVAIFFGYAGIAVARLLVRSWRMRQPAHALAVARACAQDSGREVWVGHVAVHSFGPVDGPAILGDEPRDIAERFARLVGEPVQLASTLRFFAFGRRAPFDAFFQRAFLYSSNLDGMYIPGKVPTLAVTAEFPAYRLSRTGRVLRVLLGHVHLGAFAGPRPPLWLSAGVSNLLDCGGDRDELLRLNRRVRADLARGRVQTADGLRTTRPANLGRLVRDWQHHDNFARYTQFVGQSWSLVEYRATAASFDGSPGRFGRIIKELGAPTVQGDPFERHLGRTLEAVLAEWRSWVLAADDSRHAPVDPAVRQELEQRVIRVARDRSAPLLDRMQAVRELGRAGDLIAVEPLLELLEDDATLPVEETVWALEAISGLALGGELKAWHAWWGGLQGVLRSTAAAGSGTSRPQVNA